MDSKDVKPAPLRAVEGGKREPKPKAKPEMITLAGQQYEILSECTLEGRVHWDRCVRKGGLAMLAPYEGESIATFHVRVEQRLVESGVAHRLMALRLVRLQEAWTPERAGFVPGMPFQTTAEFLSALTAPEDLAAVRDLFWRIVEAIVAEARIP